MEAPQFPASTAGRYQYYLMGIGMSFSNCRGQPDMEVNLAAEFVCFGSGIGAQRQPDSGLECAAEPTLAAVALLHLKRTAAISAVEGHLIERVNGRFGPFVTNAAPSTFRR
jgi:hypothetical protein